MGNLGQMYDNYERNLNPTTGPSAAYTEMPKTCSFEDVFKANHHAIERLDVIFERLASMEARFMGIPTEAADPSQSAVPSGTLPQLMFGMQELHLRIGRVEKVLSRLNNLI